MNLQAWNEALFRGVVKDVGRPGDPLYFYVDDEVLADISGIESPDAALEDFTQAFQAISFYQSFREAVRWKNSDYRGTPVFLAAMAITVLAVTLEPLGVSANNVYRRQNALLGKKRLSGGMPEEYDYMRSIWEIWNDYLGGPKGSKYGVPTAKRLGRYSHQGYARSQAFLRHKDKQDINMFLQERGPHIPPDASGSTMVQELRQWLKAQGSRTRLGRVASSPDFRDELGAILLASRKFVEEEEQARQSGASFVAMPMWDTYESEFHLVVSLEGVKGTQGTTIRDFDLEEHELGAGEKYVFLSSPDSGAEAWLSEPTEQWDLSETWTASWRPPEDGVYFFVEDEDEEAWISKPEPDRAKPTRILVNGLGMTKFGEHKVQLNGASQPVGFEPSGTEGHNWVTVGEQSELPADVVASLVGAKAVSSRARQHSLRGGLKLRGNNYLNGFEPDLVISGEAMSRAEAAGRAPQILVNGTDIWRYIGGADGETGAVWVSLADQTLPPGEHLVEVVVDGKRSTTRLKSTSPKTPALFPPIKRKHRHEHIVRFSWEYSPKPTVFVVGEDKALRIHPSRPVRYWLQTLEQADSTLDAFERYFDSSWLEWLYPVAGDPGEQVVVLASETGKEPWKVMLRRIDWDLLRHSPRVGEVTEASGDDLWELFKDDTIHHPVDEEVRKPLARIRRKLPMRIRNLPAYRRFRHGSRQDARPPVARRRRADTSQQILQNPYEHWLWWLTEKGDEGVSSPLAESALLWLTKRYGIAEELDFRAKVRELEALGHVHRHEGRIHALPASASWLPDSEALVALSGARGEDMIRALETGEAPELGEQENELDAIHVRTFTQSRQLSKGSNSRVPIAPETIYAQLGSRSKTASEQANALGFQFFDPTYRELRSFPDLGEILADESRAMTLSGLPPKIDHFVPRKSAPGGGWRRLTGGLSTLHTDAFLRFYTRIGRRYVWWSKDEGLLVDVGWVYGLWGFHQSTGTSDLFAVEPNKDRFAVRAYMPIPTDLERFLVMRSGLLPRVGTRRSDRSRKNAEEWRVYTNVPASIAHLVAAKLGHPWSRVTGAWPRELGEVDFV